ncbi:MAG: aminotransferase class I/II-fold pyridoxal phosphate-dependent enzyme, partial [Crocinitomicaceae bacterium]|nr:aminotransferase class I/II-fold pyridoxal phosphate-dependent enzyme [Crocinitomicaceae bacterium]
MIVEPTIHEKDNPLKVSNLIQSITPYAPGKPISEMKREYGMAHVTKLASNECPIPISEGLKSIVTQSANEIHRYPDPGCYDLKISFAKYFQVDPRWIMVGNGSNELIDLLVRTYCEPNQDYILTSKAAFLAYNLCAQAARIRSFETDLTEDFKFDLNKFKEVLKSPEGKKVRLVFIANPNNPTGTYINSNELKSFLDFCHPIENLLVVIDEAYFEFVQAQDYNTSMNWLEEYP